MPSPVKEMKDCRSCGSEIPQQASLCAVCKTYQSPWRNVLTYLASIAGFVTIVWAVFIFTLANFGEIKAMFVEQNGLEVIDLQSIPGLSTTATMVNTSEVPLYVSSMVVRWNQAAVAIDIGELIEPHKVLAFKKKAARGPKLSYIASDDGRLTNSAQNIASSYNEDDRVHCIFASYSSEDNSDRKMMEEYFSKQHRKLVFDPASMDIVFTDTRSKRRFSKPVGVVVNFAVSQPCPTPASATEVQR